MWSEYISCQHKSLLPNPVVNKMNPLHTFQPSYSRFILILSSHLHISLSSVLLSSGLPTGILYWYLRTFPECYSFHTSHHDICGEEYKLWISLLCSLSALLSLPVMSKCSALHHTLHLTNLQTLFTVYVFCMWESLYKLWGSDSGVAGDSGLPGCDTALFGCTAW